MAGTRQPYDAPEAQVKHVDDERPDDERDEQVRSALVKGLVALVVLGLVIAVGTVLTVRALGLDQGAEAGADGGSAAASPVEPLPSTALPVPGEDDASPSASATPSESASPNGGRLELEVSPTEVSAMQRINLTGTYRGADAGQLQVQRYDGGAWTDFGVDATVSAGTYQTWIMSGRTGENRLRVWDPQAKIASNVVTVTIG